MSFGQHSGGQYYVRDRGHVQGPFDLAELRRRVAARRVTRQHQASTDGIGWQKISEALPELFPAASAPQYSRPNPAAPENVPVQWEPSQEDSQGAGAIAGDLPSTSKRVNWSRIIAVAVTIIAVIAPLAVIGFLAVMIMMPSSGDKAVSSAMRPSIVTIQGLHSTAGKTRCLGIIISRTLCIAPLMAATLEGVKIEARHKDGHTEWHTSRLQTADPITGLCVLRADFGGDVTAVDLPESKQTHLRRAPLRLLSPDDESSCDIQAGILEKVLNDGDPDEMLQVDVDEEDNEALLGRAVVDKNGLLVGMAVGRLPTGESLCVSAFEVRSKKKEAAKLPADHAIAPLDLPQTAFLPGAAVRTRQDSIPTAAQLPAEPASTSAQRLGSDVDPDTRTGVQEPVPSNEASGDSPRKPAAEEVQGATPKPAGSGQRRTEPKIGGKGTRSRGTGLPSVVRQATEVATDVTDRIVPLPELPPETARELGERQLQDVCKRNRKTRDQSLQSRMRRIADEVFLAADRKPADFTVTVVENPEIQAFAFVGGNVVINTGFIDFAAGDTEMTRFVVAHEIGHIVLGHVEMPYRRELMTGELVGQQLNTVIKNSPFNQVEEEEADCFAVDIHRKKRWTIDGGVRFFTRIRDREETPDETDDMGTVVETMFSSHPDHDRRIELLRHGCND